MCPKQPIKQSLTPTYETELHGCAFQAGIAASQVFHAALWVFTLQADSLHLQSKKREYGPKVIIVLKTAPLLVHTLIAL